MTDLGQDDDPQTRRVRELLRDLADDPQAPPSTVTPLSVIAAAKRAAAAAPETASQHSQEPGASPRSAAVPTSGAVSAQPWFRRTRLLTVAAAAAGVVAIGAIALPFALQSAPDTAGSAAQSTVSAPAPAASAERDAADAGGAAENPPAPEAAPGGQGGQADANESAAAAAESSAAAGLVESTGETLCAWPVLPDAVVSAAVNALPPGGFTNAGAADGPCDADIVGAATIADPAGTDTLVVRVSRTPPAACTLDDPPTAAPCELAADGSYRTEAGTDGGQVVFVYGDGYQVQAIPPSGAVTSDELSAVADAVLAAMG